MKWHNAAYYLVSSNKYKKLTRWKALFQRVRKNGQILVVIHFLLYHFSSIKNYIGQESGFTRVLNEFNDQISNAKTKKAWLALEDLKSVSDYSQLNLNIHRIENTDIKIDIISDFMVQAIELASDKKFHPAAAGILMGASLEEFLKKIAEENNLDLTGIKLTIDPISKII